MRVLTQRELNRAVLARQLLLERSGTSLPRALDRIGGIQSQYAPSMYFGLWSRVDGFERDALTRALERRTVIQGTLMRVTIHLVSRAGYWPLAIATREPRRVGFLRSRRTLSDAQMAAAARRVQAALADHGALKRTAIDQLVGKERAQGVGLWIDMVRVPPSGTWERRRADTYGLAADWLGPPPELSVDDALDHLVTTYLRAFGPASRDDVVAFTGITNKGALAPILERLKLRRFQDEQGGELLDVPRAPLPDPDTPAPVRYLPTFDATLLGHARNRTGILTDEDRGRVFATKYPQSFPTFLVDGTVAGTWKVGDKGKVELSPFRRLDGGTLGELRAEGDRLRALTAERASGRAGK